MFKMIVAALAIALGAIGAESQIDFRVDTDPNDLANKSSFNLVTTTSFQNDEHALLFTPEMSFYSNGAIDFSVSAGHRHLWKGAVWGHHVFFDRSNAGLYSIDQMGTGFDLLTDLFDFRVNYYEPLIARIKFPFFRLSPCRWMDGEIFFKTRWFGVGTGPMYNFRTREWALHSRLVIPFQTWSVGFGALCGENGQPQGLLSLSFHLFKPRASSALISPPSHVQKSNVYYEFESAGGVNTITPVIFNDFYNPKIVNYIEQTEDDVTFQDRSDNDNR